MNLADQVIKTPEDLTKLKEFVKLPENKLWLGEVTAFFRALKSGPTIATEVQLDAASQKLLRLAQRAVNLGSAATQGSDFDDKELIEKFCGVLQVHFHDQLSPAMRVLMNKKD